MVYIPALPPFSATGKTIRGSLIAEEAVTAVTQVTEPAVVHVDEDVKADSVGTPVNAEVARFDSRSSETVRIGFSDLINQWVRERRTVGIRCASSMHCLHRSFCRWARLALDADMEDKFADELRQRGFVEDASGLVPGLIVIEDLAAALTYERSANKRQPSTLKNRKWPEMKGVSKVIHWAVSVIGQ